MSHYLRQLNVITDFHIVTALVCKLIALALEMQASEVRVHFSTSVSDRLQGELSKKVVPLGGSVVVDVTNFTHFVTASPVKGDSSTGFRKSIAALMALAAGTPYQGTACIP